MVNKLLLLSSLLSIFTSLIVSVSATITFPATTTNPTPLKVRNYDFPGLQLSYSFTGPLQPAVFQSNLSCILNLTNKTAPGGILIINAMEAYKAGCGKYSDIPLNNGWFHECNAPASEKPAEFQTETEQECSRKRFDLAVVVEPATGDFCCQYDPLFFRFTAQFTLHSEGRFQDSKTILTGKFHMAS
jgi:hypothetical protein